VDEYASDRLWSRLELHMPTFCFDIGEIEPIVYNIKCYGQKTVTFSFTIETAAPRHTQSGAG
jgi:hypothetical protein